MLGGRVVGGICLVRFAVHRQKISVQHVWVGGFGHLFDDFVNEPHTQLDSPKEGIQVEIGFQPRNEEEGAAENRDREEQFRDRRGGLHFPEDGRRDQQLDDRLGRHCEGQRQRDDQHAFALLPGEGHHEAGVAPEAVVGFIFGFHQESPRALSWPPVPDAARGGKPGEKTRHMSPFRFPGEGVLPCFYDSTKKRPCVKSGTKRAYFVTNCKSSTIFTLLAAVFGPPAA